MATVENQAAGHVVLYNVSWSTYEALVTGTDESGARFTYDRGALEIMSPSRKHERLKKLIGRLIEVTAEEWKIPIGSGGSTTIKSAMKERGLEPDQCYYIANEKRMREKDDFDINVDPPPDLVVEVDVTASSLNRMGLYAAFGVPEVWRYDGTSLQVSILQPDGAYALQEQSRSFPALPLSEIPRRLGQRTKTDETSWIRSFRQWVRQVRP